MSFGCSFLSHQRSEDPALYISKVLPPDTDWVAFSAAIKSMLQETPSNSEAQCFHFGRSLEGVTGLSVWQHVPGLCTWLQSSPREAQTYGKVSLYIWACSKPNVAHLDLISYITPASKSRKTNQTTASLQRKQTGQLPTQTTQDPWDGLGQK